MRPNGVTSALGVRNEEPNVFTLIKALHSNAYRHCSSLIIPLLIIIPHQFFSVFMQKDRLFLFDEASRAGLLSAKVGEGVAALITAFDVECCQGTLRGFEKLFDLETRLKLDRARLTDIVTEVTLDT